MFSMTLNFFRLLLFISDDCFLIKHIDYSNQNSEKIIPQTRRFLIKPCQKKTRFIFNVFVSNTCANFS